MNYIYIYKYIQLSWEWTKWLQKCVTIKKNVILKILHQLYIVNFQNSVAEDLKYAVLISVKIC